MVNFLRLIEVFLTVTGSLGLGFVFLYIFSRFIMYTSSIPNYWDEKESEFINKEIALNAHMINTLYKIGSPQDNGRYSEEQEVIWSEYRELKKQYDDLFAKHIQVVVYHNEN